MSWALPIYQSVALSEFLQQTLLSPSLDLGSTCVSGVDGKSLWIEAQTPADTATLPAMVQVCNQYLNLADGEIAICNDPYTGGTELSHITLVCGLGTLKGAKSDFVLGTRLALEPRWSESGKLSDEGVRIPPTPLGSLTSPNTDLLAMISSQPQSSRGFESGVRTTIAKLASVHQTLQRALGDRNGIFHRTCGKDFLADSARMFRKQIGHLALGESFASTRLSSGEFIKLRLKVEDEKILFDFSGSDASQNVHLTELMTFSACFAALQDVLGHKVACNAGALDSIVVSAPAKTFLNAKAPAGTWRGAHEGVSGVLAFLVQHLRQQNKIALPAAVAVHPGFFEMSFDGLSNGFFFKVTNGLHSNPLATFETQLSFASTRNSSQMSVEELEANFPLRVQQFGDKRDSGGAGQVRGGDQKRLTLEILAPVKVRWNFSAQPGETEASLQGSVVTTDLTQKDHRQPARGEMTLSAGQTVSFVSAAGRGFGDLKTDDEI